MKYVYNAEVLYSYLVLAVQIDRSKSVQSPKPNTSANKPQSSESQPETDDKSKQEIAEAFSNGAVPPPPTVPLDASRASSTHDESAYPSPLDEGKIECQDLSTQVVQPEPSPSDLSFNANNGVKDQIFDAEARTSTTNLAQSNAFVSSLLSDVTTCNGLFQNNANSNNTFSAVDRVLNPISGGGTSTQVGANRFSPLATLLRNGTTPVLPGGSATSGQPSHSNISSVAPPFFHTSSEDIAASRAFDNLQRVLFSSNSKGSLSSPDEYSGKVILNSFTKKTLLSVYMKAIVFHSEKIC